MYLLSSQSSRRRFSGSVPVKAVVVEFLVGVLGWLKSDLTRVGWSVDIFKVGCDPFYYCDDGEKDIVSLRGRKAYRLGGLHSVV